MGWNSSILTCTNNDMIFCLNSG